MAGPGTRALQFRSKVLKDSLLGRLGLGSSFSRKRTEVRRPQPPPSSHTLGPWGPRLIYPDPVQLRALTSGEHWTPRHARIPFRRRPPAGTLTHLVSGIATLSSDSSSFLLPLSWIPTRECLRTVGGGARRAENSPGAAAKVSPGRSHTRGAWSFWRAEGV